MKKYLLYLLTQFACIFIVSLLSYLIRPIPPIHYICIYALLPLLSCISACRITMKGVNPYLSWLLPPFAQTISGFLSTLGIGQNPLPVFITAFLGLIGGAAGDVINKMKKDKS